MLRRSAIVATFDAYIKPGRQDKFSLPGSFNLFKSIPLRKLNGM
jgi:hypothetical protein